MTIQRCEKCGSSLGANGSEDTQFCPKCADKEKKCWDICRPAQESVASGGVNHASSVPGKCLFCEHETCPTCYRCHNMECGEAVRPLKKCFDSLLPPKVKEVINDLAKIKEDGTLREGITTTEKNRPHKRNDHPNHGPDDAPCHCGNAPGILTNDEKVGQQQPLSQFDAKEWEEEATEVFYAASDTADVGVILKYIAAQIVLAEKRERARWLNQPANEHDAKIRADERSRFLEEIGKLKINIKLPYDGPNEDYLRAVGFNGALDAMEEVLHEV